MEVSSVLVVIFVISLLAWFTKRKYGSNIPHGPMGLPLIGYLPFLTTEPYIKLSELRRKYGPIYRIYLGTQEVVVLCGFNIIKEAFARDECIGRAPPMHFELTEDSIRAGVFSGTPWKEQKRFTMQMIGDLGCNNTRKESHLKKDVKELIQRLTAISKNPVSMSDMLAPSAVNNISSLMFGKRFKHNDPTIRKLAELLSNLGKFTRVLPIQMFFPCMKDIIKYINIGNFKKLIQATDELEEYIKKEIQEHEENLVLNDTRDYLDGYILEIIKRSNEPQTTFKKSVLCDVTRGLVVAGSEPIRIVIDWLLLLCAAYPKMQKKIHQEIATVLGSDRIPSYEDRIYMPYTEACILELMRWRTPNPLNFLRYTSKDIEIKGFFIPKHTRILGVPYAIDHDEKLWGDDVDVYKPERFLSQDGLKVVKPEHFKPFSTGKRSCPAKTIALSTVFVYLTAILQKFELSLPSGKQADFEGFCGIILQPERQEICLRIRH